MEENEQPRPKRASGVAQKIKRFLNGRWGETAVFAALTFFALLFTVIFYSIKFTEFDYLGTERGDLNFWTAGLVNIDEEFYIQNLNIYFIIAFTLAAALYTVAFILKEVKRNKKVFIAASAFNIGICLVALILGAVASILKAGAIVCVIFSMLFCVAMLAFLIARRKSATAPAGDKKARTQLSPEKHRAVKIAVLVTECAALLALLTVFFVPLYSQTDGGDKTSYMLFGALSSKSDSPVFVSIAFIVMLIAFFAEILYFAATVSDYMRSDALFIKSSKALVTSAAVATLAYFGYGYGLVFGLSVADKADGALGTVSFVPFIISMAVLIVHAVFAGILRRSNDTQMAGLLAYAVANGKIKIDGKPQERKVLRIEPLIGLLAMTGVTFISLCLNIVQIKIKLGGLYQSEVVLSGYKLLTTYKGLESGFQMLAFIEFAFLVMSGVMFAVTLISFFASDKNYYKLVKTGTIANFMFVLILGLFGVYYQIGQKVNMENLQSLISSLGINILPDYEYEVASQTIYMIIASIIVVAVMFFRGIFSLGAPVRVSAQGDGKGKKPDEKKPDTAADDKRKEELKKEEEKLKEKEEKLKELEKELKEKENSLKNENGFNGFTPPAAFAPERRDEPPVDFDACPAFTELDRKKPLFDAELFERRQKLFESPTLPALVRFVVDYARESRLHLSYSVEDIATFVAGLGASRLTILQGMSGTGKTSLPKIFTEALMGNCEIVEVESSWRDKNELLGYYNEFSKCFTPKKFTQVLYKVRLNPSVITLIVLDEMNLSRIEYYFSDFLSLMEHEEGKREIKLLNVKLARTENGERREYAALTDGHTIKIPSNVWFIGTANRDESTFEISDKVYDRAQTMNFNKRAPKVRSFGAPLDARFIAYDTLVGLFDEAKMREFDAESNKAVISAEKLLSRYNISFGNRILKQMEEFVKIYCACFGDGAAVEADAVEKILLSKVVSKLENKVVENKEALAVEFDRAGLKECGAFVRRLNED